MIIDQLIFAITESPKRLWRLIMHLCLKNDFLRSYRSCSLVFKSIVWLIEFMVLILDLLFVGDLYQILLLCVDRDIRTLSRDEKLLARSIFPHRLNLKVVKLHGKSRWVDRFDAWAFVSFNTIQFKQHLSPDLLIHELVHVWQYQGVGAVYITRALYALHHAEAYDYGGASSLLDEVKVGKKLLDYNYEQQAQIVQDYFKLQREFDGKSLMLAHNQYVLAYQNVLQTENLLV